MCVKEHGVPLTLLQELTHYYEDMAGDCEGLRMLKEKELNTIAE